MYKISFLRMFYKIYEIIYSEILLNKITSPLDASKISATLDGRRCLMHSFTTVIRESTRFRTDFEPTGLSLASFRVGGQSTRLIG